MLLNDWPRRIFWVAVLGLVTCGGCGFGAGDRGGSASCDDVTAWFDNGGLGAPMTLPGKATVTANQLRLEGKIALEASGGGDITFEFTSSILFGAQREDFVFALVGDTIRIIDRERGIFYEGGEAEYFLRETFALDFDVAPLIRLALGAHPNCSVLEDMRIRRDPGGAATVSGKLSGEDFRVQFDGPRGRIQDASWPIGGRERPDRLHVRYNWGPEVLDRVEMRVEGREWRCRIVRSK